MSSNDKPTINPAPNGPYIVKTLKQFASQKGTIECRETMALCRCGASENKPYCDGSHAKIGFSSDKLETRTEDRQDSYKGKQITIHDNRSICAHAGACTDGLPSVFRMKQEPWIDADAATIEEIIATIDKCPSGALSYTVDAPEPSSQDEEPAVFIAPNGPYVVSGGEGLLDTVWGDGASKNNYALCRCGASKNKPFCDGSHWTVEFKDDKN